MRVVVAHSRYRSASSGENQVVADETRLLEDAGHEVVRWEPSPEHEHGISLVNTGTQAIWSIPAVRHLRSLLRDTGADVLHVHNLFPKLSPAALRVARQERVAAVMTLHNYRMLCLPATLLRDGRTCEECVGHLPWRGVQHGCYRGSRLGSAALAVSLSLHRALRSFERPQLLLAVSEFVRRKHIDAGWRADTIRVKSNFAWPCTKRYGPGELFLYVGRLSPEKGVDDLLRAWKGIDASLVVVGDGPDDERLRTLAPPNVQFTGALARAAVDELLTRARALLVPSIGYEGQPRTILEAFAAGVPVVANRVGALPEVIDDGVSGLLVEPSAEGSWRDATTRLLDDDLASRLGRGAFEAWNRQYCPTVALDALVQAYTDAIEAARL
jgi:glycosyltransferase involved in cell wall biosynthesis